METVERREYKRLWYQQNKARIRRKGYLQTGHRLPKLLRPVPLTMVTRRELQRWTTGEPTIRLLESILKGQIVLLP